MSQFWERWRQTAARMTVARLALIFNGVVVVVVVGAVGWQLWSQRLALLEQTRVSAESLAREQSSLVAEDFETIERVLSLFQAQLNTLMLEGGSSEAHLQDLLRQVQMLLPGSLDVLLARDQGGLLAASLIATGRGGGHYCPQIEGAMDPAAHRLVFVYRGSSYGRCPPEGTLVLAHRLRTPASHGKAALWILLDPAYLFRELSQDLHAHGGVTRYRVVWGSQREVVAQLQPRTPSAPEFPMSDQPEPDMAHAWIWPAAFSGQPWVVARAPVGRTEFSVELMLDGSVVLQRQWIPHVIAVSLIALLVLTGWAGISYALIRAVHAHQRQIQAKNEREESTLEYAGVGVWEWDIASGALQWSRQIGPLFGYAVLSEPPSIEFFMSCVHPEDRQKVQQAIERSLSHGEPYLVEHRIVWPDGSIRTVREKGNVRRDRHGKAVGMFGVVLDITEQQEVARNLQTILDNVVDAIITIDEGGIITSFNQAAAQIFGYDLQDVIGRNVSMLMPEPHHSAHDGYLRHHHATGESRIIGAERELEALRKSGEVFPIGLTVSEVDHYGKPLYIGLIRDVTENKRAEQEIQRLAYFDQLTGLPNRRLLLDRVARALLGSRRTGQCGALVFMDLDNFKSLNDTRGHEAGDLLLKQVSERLQHAVREGDTVGRLGGDEFVLLLENLGVGRSLGAAHSEQVAHKVLAALAQGFVIQGHPYRGSASLGIAVFDGDPVEVDALMGYADVAMYQAKSDGRGVFRFYDARLQEELKVRATLASDMRHGLARDEFFLAYQPQIDDSGLVRGVEALLRWRHPVRGMVSPAEFIGVAEQDGLILELGRWVLQAACTQLARWADQPSMATLTVSINVSARQLRDDAFVRHVMDALDMTRVNPALLKLELTESALVDDADGVSTRMDTLRRLGLTFSLDDFGTGYSSLSYLRRLPIAQLKIDRSFVTDVNSDSNAATIARSVVALGQALGLEVVAEGVETQAQRDFLQQCGCQIFQGYLFSRPLTADQLSTFMASLGSGSAAAG